MLLAHAIKVKASVDIDFYRHRYATPEMTSEASCDLLMNAGQSTWKRVLLHTETGMQRLHWRHETQLKILSSISNACRAVVGSLLKASKVVSSLHAR